MKKTLGQIAHEAGEKAGGWSGKWEYMGEAQRAEWEAIAEAVAEQVRKEGDRVAELKRAIEAMRVAGGSVEFQMAFDMAKALIATPNAKSEPTDGLGVAVSPAPTF